MADATSSTAQVLLVIHAPTVPICSERRLPSQAAIAEIQQRLELLSGIPPESQQLSLWTTRTDDMDSHARLVTEIPLPQQQDVQKTDTSTTLASLGARDGMGLKVLDARGATVSNQFSTEEEERVQKFELDDVAYAQRTGKYEMRPLLLELFALLLVFTLHSRPVRLCPCIQEAQQNWTFC